MLKVMTVFGTRPEAIRWRLSSWNSKNIGSNPDGRGRYGPAPADAGSGAGFIQIRPDYDLDIMSQGQTLYDITTRSCRG